MYIKERNDASIENLCLIFFVLVCIAMLLIRDVVAIHINKYFFVLLISGCILFFNIENATYFYLFLLPVYFGLPGNYITFAFLIKCILVNDQFNIKIKSLIFFLLFIGCLYFRIFLDGGLTATKIALAPSVFIVVLLFSMKGRLDESKICLFYSLGVAVLGAIMLLSALKVNSLSDLLSSHYRLGTKRVDLASTAATKTVTDPNYYGFFVIGAVTISMHYILRTVGETKKKRILVVLNLISLFVAVVGLSRTFIVCIFLTGFLFVVGESSFKSAFLFGLSAALVFIIIRFVFPDLFFTVFSRFSDDTVEGGNGRIEFITTFFTIWTRDISSFLLGVNIFYCNVHCFPLQVLYGGGILSAISGALLIISLHEKKEFKDDISKILKYGPGAVIVLYSSTVPVATMINVFSPIFVAALAYRSMDRTGNNYSKPIIKTSGKYFKHSYAKYRNFAT